MQMTKGLILLVSTAVFSVIINSCKTLNIPVKPERAKNSAVEIIEGKTRNYNYPEDMLIKNAVLKVGEEENTIRLNIYLKKDEFIFINGRYLGFEIFRIMVGNDSVKYINRFQRTYFFGNISNLKEDLGFDLELIELQRFIYSGFINTELYNKNYIKTNFKAAEDGIKYNYIVEEGRKIDLLYDFAGDLEKIDVSDHVNSVYINADISRIDKEIKSLTGQYLKNNNTIMWDLEINNIENKVYNNLDFRIGKNYYELPDIL